MKVKVRVVQKGKPLPPEKVCISTEYIRLDAFLKLANACLLYTSDAADE